MDLDRLCYYTDWHDHANRRRYEAPADPWRLVEVDPQTVEFVNNELRLNWGLGRVQGGDWDRESEPLAETTTYRGLVHRFEEGRDWDETAIWERAREAFDRGERLRGYETLEAFREERCAYLDDLFAAVRDEGYRPNSDAGHENPATGRNAFEDAYVHHLEPLVVVTRDGEIHWTEGYHRLVIARILGVEAVPVQVLCRHVEWQRTRNRLARCADGDERSTTRDEFVDHPDVTDALDRTE